MRLGFVSAILPDTPLRELFEFAAIEGYECIEVMCWPVGKAERRYAGVTHIDVNNLNAAAMDEIRESIELTGIQISALGYYPNTLTPDAAEAESAVAHLKKVIAAAPKLEVDTVTSFIGRDWTKSVDENWPLFLKTWKPLIAFAEDHGVRIAIENCPMSFGSDEWPGGKNLACTPSIWRRMFNDIPSDNFGLNYDPSHLVWQMMDEVEPMWEFREKSPRPRQDVRTDHEVEHHVGIPAHPSEYHAEAAGHGRCELEASPSSPRSARPTSRSRSKTAPMSLRSNAAWLR